MKSAYEENTRMNKRICTLSKRFEDDGKVEEYITRSAIPALKSLREYLDSGRSNRVTHHQCPLCRKEEFLLIASKDRQGLPLETLICEKCGLVFSGSYFDSQSAAIYYSTYCYQIKNNGRSAEEMFKNRVHPAAYSWLRYHWVKNNLRDEFSKIKTVMEIGCNDGCNLYPYHQNKCVVFGCDFDEERMNTGRAVGMNIFSGGVEKLRELPVRADLVILSHSLEHMPDIDAALIEARELLADDGKVYIEVPGLKGLIRQDAHKICDNSITSTNNFLSQLQFEHNYFFEWKTLTRFASRNGLISLCGDEYIRSLFQVGEKSNGHCASNEGERVLHYLSNIERDWQESNPLWKKTAKQIKRQLWKLKR